MKTIDVDGLPEAVARALAGFVEALRNECRVRSGNGQPRRPVTLQTRRGTVSSKLTRKEIYEDEAKTRRGAE
jgi:hypothetical protein